VQCNIEFLVGAALILTFSHGEKGLPFPRGEGWVRGMRLYRGSARVFTFFCYTALALFLLTGGT
jgi:hypothetical protein